MERVPLVVEQDAAQMEDSLGAFTAPTHSRTVEADAHKISHGALDRAGADHEVVTAKSIVAHAHLVLDQVFLDVEKALASPLVPGAGLGDSSDE